MAEQKLSIGDRVQVSDDWHDADLRGATGTLWAYAATLDGESPPDSAYWIELDKPLPRTDIALIDADCLLSI